jgi:hypothetical protein
VSTLNAAGLLLLRRLGRRDDRSSVHAATSDAVSAGAWVGVAFRNFGARGNPAGGSGSTTRPLVTREPRAGVAVHGIPRTAVRRFMSADAVHGLGDERVEGALAPART